MHVAGDMVLLAYSEHGIQHTLDRFSAEYDEAGMKICTKKCDAFCLSRNSSQCTLQVTSKQHYTSAGGDDQIFWGIIHK